jgi:hypothetical protein
MHEIVLWLTGKRVPLPQDAPPSLIDANAFDLGERAKEMPDEELITRATILRGEALRVSRALADRLVLVSPSLASTGPVDTTKIAAVVNNLITYAAGLRDSLRRAKPTRVISYDQDPSLFGFKKGDKVAWRTSSGGPDPEDTGTVVDGVWEGQLGGGSYTVRYLVARQDKNRFWAGPLELVRVPG